MRHPRVSTSLVIRSVRKRCQLSALAFAILACLLTLQTFANELPRVQMDPLFEKSTEGLEYIVPIGDVEGMPRHIETQMRDGILGWDQQDGWRILDPKATLLINGDLMRRGPFAIRATRAALEIHRKQPDQIKLNIGNHDGNILSWHLAHMRIRAGIDQNYLRWLKTQNRGTSLASQLFYWSENMGLREKVLNFWLESVLIDHYKERPNQTSSKYADQFITQQNGRTAVDPIKLSLLMTEDAMAQAFHRWVSPGGEGWELLRVAKLRDHKTFNGFDTIVDFSHSGSSTPDNWGVIPTISERYLDSGSTVEYTRWIKDMDKDFKLAQLSQMESLIAQARSTSDPRALSKLAEAYTRMELLHTTDSMWSTTLPEIPASEFHRSDSQVYNDPRMEKESGLPSIAEPHILTQQVRSGLSVTIGGHRPIGRVATLMVGFDPLTKKRVLSIYHDTSYSDLEGHNLIRVYANGAVRIVGLTDKGEAMVMEHPGDKLLGRWADEIRPFQTELVNAAKEWRKPNLPEEITKKATLVDRYNRVGRVVGGRLIIGFATKKAPDGSLVADYDRYITLRKEGRNFMYQPVDIYEMQAFESNNGELAYPQADLTDMMLNAEKEKAERLRKAGLTVLSEQQFQEALAGKIVIDLAGYSANISQVQRDPEGHRNITRSMIAFRHSLFSIPLQESVVFLTGGTAGWESMRTRIINEVNLARVRAGGKPFEMVGCAALVFGLGEVDTNLKKMFLLPRTFSWNDFKSNLIRQHVLPSKARQIVLSLAGGGGIIGTQLQQALDYAKQDRRVTVRLERGITVQPGDRSHKNRSAVDKFLDRVDRGEVKLPSRVHIINTDRARDRKKVARSKVRCKDFMEILK